MEFITTLNQLNKQLAVTIVRQLHDNKVLWIGVMRYDYCLRLTKLRQRYGKKIDGDMPLMITTVCIGDRTKCEAFIIEWLKTNPWPESCTYIICNDNNVMYASAREAAAALGVNESALHNHLAGRPGYRTVGGKTFRRGVL